MKVTETTEDREVVKVEKVRTGVIVELDEGEAADLLRILRNIGGSPYNTPRRTSEALSGHLARLGVEPALQRPRIGMEF